MNTDRRTAALVGILCIVGTIAGGSSMAVTAGLLDAPDLLATLASHSGQAMLAALLVLVMGVALALVATLMFPILRRYSETVAIGYVIFRGALETLTYIAVALCWLALVLVSRQYAGAGPEAASQLNAVGTLLVGAKGLPILAVQDIFFSVGALMLCGLLYRVRLVPRWLSGWGIVGVVAPEARLLPLAA